MQRQMSHYITNTAKTRIEQRKTAFAYVKIYCLKSK
jgi:hypothetical protein